MTGLYSILLPIVVAAFIFCSCTNHERPCCFSGRCPCMSDQVINGNADISDKTFDALTINGFAHIANSTFETLTINGRALLDKIIVQKDVVVNGAADITHSTMRAVTTINGSMKISDSTFSQLRLYTAHTHSLERSTIAMLKITVSRPEQEITIELIDSVVTGDVQFEGSRQATLVLKGSALVKGQVHGARVQRG